ncbi:cytochrome P450 4C1-like [Vanessa atalanta]|uniref:cytochrome P450 4C1-like n=1 Tax=Vanessa atalanta TaxID=42275 RepID=UPI001FCD2EB5|nr:cytochrome P450 4C1-like [Vanessa atalanta]
MCEKGIWRARRKINAVALTPKHIDKFVSVYARNSQVMADKLAVYVRQGDVPLWDHYCPYILLTACETILGNSVNLHPREFQPFCEAFISYFDNVITRLCRPWLYNITMYKLLPEATKQSLKKKIVWNFINNLIFQKRELMKKKQSDSSEEEDYSQQGELKSLLELLITKSGYSEAELREESLVLLLASIDTTVSVNGFASVLLSQHLDVQDKVYEEIKNVFDDFHQTITIDDLNKLKYLEAVLKETMRLYPTTPLIMRKCLKDVKLPSGLVLSEGCQVLVNIWGLHRNPKYWGPDADKFRPERFLDITPEQQSAFIPFSSGPRNCAVDACRAARLARQRVREAPRASTPAPRASVAVKRALRLVGQRLTAFS